MMTHVSAWHMKMMINHIHMPLQHTGHMVLAPYFWWLDYHYGVHHICTEITITNTHLKRLGQLQHLGIELQASVSSQILSLISRQLQTGSDLNLTTFQHKWACQASWRVSLFYSQIMELPLSIQWTMKYTVWNEVSNETRTLHTQINIHFQMKREKLQ